MPGEIDVGHAAFVRRDWAATYAALTGRDLAADDLELLAVAAYLIGRDGESTSAWEASHRAWLDSGDVGRAARSASWLALTHLLRGEVAVANGWLARAERMIDEIGPDCPARGMVLVLEVIAALDEGDATRAGAAAAEITSVGRRFADGDVLAFGLLTSGEAAIAAGDAAGGTRLFDEVMVALDADDVSPVTAGIVYCAVVEGCLKAFDLRRAAEWTEEFRRWSAAQPDLVPYRGQCLVHRSQVLQARGQWTEAVAEADRAHRLLSEPAHPALSLATYQRGELHRLRGDLDDADRAFRSAATLGFEPVPGLILLRLEQGRLREAVADVERLVDPARASLVTPTVLAAAVEVFLAVGDTGRARWASTALQDVATQMNAPVLMAAAAHAAGLVRLADGWAADALELLVEARDRARALDLRYETARAQVAIAAAHRALGDMNAATLELDAAIAEFGELGASRDLERARIRQRNPVATAGGLSGRECEVLRLVAEGKTNRDIGTTLRISEHTVARHLQNIFTKLGLSSRAAATAYAYEHELIARGDQR